MFLAHVCELVNDVSTEDLQYLHMEMTCIPVGFPATNISYQLEMLPTSAYTHFNSHLDFKRTKRIQTHTLIIGVCVIMYWLYGQQTNTTKLQIHINNTLSADLILHYKTDVINSRKIENLSKTFQGKCT